MTHDPQGRPLRTCAGCRAVRPRPDLLRIAVGPGGTGILDLRGRAPGRGVYLCRTTAPECLDRAHRRRALTRSLRVGENVMDYEALGREIASLATDLEEPPSPR
jgi:predicted RNA-binding protein YlxR (DUF448 family)